MKKILLQTIPHSGTHTVHYLFNVLGGIEVLWHHWEKKCLEDIEIAKNIDWDDIVFVRTDRSADSLRETFLARAVSKMEGLDYFGECIEIFLHHHRAFPMPISINIEGSIEHMTKMARRVFHECGVEPPPAAEEYMKTWHRINSRHDEDNRVTKAIKESIHKGRISTWHTK